MKKMIFSTKNIYLKRVGVAMCALVVLCALAASHGCRGCKEDGKSAMRPPMTAQDNRRPPPPLYLKPVRGEFVWPSDGEEPQFSLELPEGGWYQHTDLRLAVGTDIAFVQGDSANPGIIVAVAQGAPLPHGATVEQTPLVELEILIQGRAVEYFEGWAKKFVPETNKTFLSPEDAPGAPYAYVEGEVVYPENEQTGLEHSTAFLFFFDDPDGSTMTIVVTYPDLFHYKYWHYIEDIVSSFKVY